jgi:hypothetical protein
MRRPTASVRRAQAALLHRCADRRLADLPKPFPDRCDEVEARTLIAIALGGLPPERRAEVLADAGRRILALALEDEKLPVM